MASQKAQKNDAASVGDETEEILASVGSRVRDMHAYEDSVIREATLRSAPVLEGRGFPDLAPLGPSYDARRGNSIAYSGSVVDVPTIRTVLARVRSQIQSQRNTAQEETHANLLLRIKEQMLLTYLQKVANLSPDDMPVDPIREEKLERKRSLRIMEAPVDASTAIDVDEQPSAKKKQKSAVVSTQGPQSAADRLEAIKQDGTLARSVTSASATSSFGKQALADQKQNRLARPRTSMMYLKQLGVSNQDEEQAQRKELLRQKRKERKELRRQRREQWVERQEESDEENELTFDDDESDDNKAVESSSPSQQTVDQVAVSQNGNVESASSLSLSNSLTCPLCQQRIIVESDADGDALLSQHIDQCQRRGRRTRRQAPSSRDSYSEREDISTHGSSGSVSTRKRSAKTTTTATKRKPLQRKAASYVSLRQSLDDLQECDYEDRVDEWIESGVQRMREMQERDQNETPPGAALYGDGGDNNGLVVPAWMNNRLFPYQRTGLRWLWELHMQEAGGIVGDEMGLGKTVQVCSFLGAMALGRKLNSVLVICPATMLQHWLTEMSTWAPGLRRILIHQSGEIDGLSRSVSPKLLRTLEKWLRRARADRVNEPIDEDDLETMDEDSFCGTGYVVITTFESVRRSTDIWTAHNWSYCVLDEGQKIRNPDADVTLACKRIRTPHRLLLSGTPIQNDLRELWSLFDFVFPGRLGTLPAFEAEFADPIRRGGYSNASPMQVQLGYRCALALRDLINPYLLRRQKKDIKEVSRMPGKTEHVLFCRLSSRQRTLYEAYLQSDAVMNMFRGSPQLLSAITVLRKICNHPDLVCGPDESSFQSFVKGRSIDPDVSDDSMSEDDDEELEYGESLVERAGKLEVLVKILPLWHKQGHRVLIFCQWRKMLNIIQRFVQMQGWKFSRLDGNTNIASRQRLVDAFNTDESYFGMLMTTRTGGIGLNLTGASRVILYDPDWNPQLDAQARERSWRFGQKNAVTVYRLITSGTIEEKIYQRQIFKTALTNKVLQDPRQRRLFSQRDLRDFFTLKPDSGSVVGGGNGFTETGQITKGTGVVDPDAAIAMEPSGAADSNRDNMDILQRVMKSKGLAGVFDHDVVEGTPSKKGARVREMEEKAKTVAREAAKALRESAVGGEAFQPTWTGSDETRASRFGGGKPSAIAPRAYNGREDRGFGGADTAGVSNTNKSAGMSSSGLLANLKSRNAPDGSAAPSDSDLSQYTELLRRLRNFVKRNGGQRAGGGPTTDDILRSFESVPNCDAAIFRRLLNSVASVENGRWRLKS